MKPKSLLAAAILFLVPGLAFARSKNSANVELDQPVTVAGTQLAPGHYKVIWEGSGSDVTVRFAEGKKTIATAPAKLVNSQTNEDAIETDSAADHTTVLRAIDLQKISLQFDNTKNAAGN